MHWSFTIYDDNGKAIKFCDFVYNVEPNISIDYLNGDNIVSGSDIEGETNKDISSCNIDLNKTKYVYNGKIHKPKIKLKYGTDRVNSFKTQYKDNVKVGIAKVKVIGTGKYKGSKTKTFKIVPRAAAITKISKGKGCAFVKWRRVLKQADGYQIRYSKKRSMKGSKKVWIKSYKSSKKTFSKLQRHKKYYFQIRTYKNVGSKKYYSNWGSRKSVRVE